MSKESVLSIEEPEKMDFLEWCDQYRIQVSVVRSKGPGGEMVWRTSCVPSISIWTRNGFVGVECGGSNSPSDALKALADKISGATMALGGQYEKTYQCPELE